MVKIKDLLKLGGHRMVKQYDSSISKILAAVYPDYDWLPWKFDLCPHNYWDDIKNQKKFIEWARKELKIKEMSDWYHVSTQVIEALYVFIIITKKLIDLGCGLLKQSSNSLASMLSIVYPEYEWLPWKFDLCPRNFWTQSKNQRKFMDWAGKELKINEINDWYSKSSKVLYLFFSI